MTRGLVSPEPVTDPGATAQEPEPRGRASIEDVVRAEASPQGVATRLQDWPIDTVMEAVHALRGNAFATAVAEHLATAEKARPRHGRNAGLIRDLFDNARSVPGLESIVSEQLRDAVANAVAARPQAGAWTATGSLAPPLSGTLELQVTLDPVSSGYKQRGAGDHYLLLSLNPGGEIQGETAAERQGSIRRFIQEELIHELLHLAWSVRDEAHAAGATGATSLTATQDVDIDPLRAAAIATSEGVALHALVEAVAPGWGDRLCHWFLDELAAELFARHFAAARGGASATARGGRSIAESYAPVFSSRLERESGVSLTADDRARMTARAVRFLGAAQPLVITAAQRLP